MTRLSSGRGPTGSIGAVTLAEAGLKVLLVEAADEFGGGLRSGPLTGLDGFTHDLCATVLPLARASAAFRDLDLDVEWAFPAVQAAHPLDGQDAVLIHRDVGETADGLGSPQGRARLAADRRRGGGSRPGSGRAVIRAGGQPALPAVGRPARRSGWPGTGRSAACPRPSSAGPCSTASEPAPRSPGWPRTRWSTSAGPSPAATGCCWPRSRTRSAGRSSAAARRGSPRPSSTASPSCGGVAETGHQVKDLADVAARPGHPARPDAPAGARRLRRPAACPRTRAGSRAYRYGPGVFKLDWALSGPVPWRDPAVGGAATVHLGGTLGEIARAEAEVAAGRHPERPVRARRPAVRGRPVPRPGGSTCCGRTAMCRTARQPTGRPRSRTRWSGSPPASAT